MYTFCIVHFRKGSRTYAVAESIGSWTFLIVFKCCFEPKKLRVKWHFMLAKANGCSFLSSFLFLIVLVVQFMRDYATICELCDIMRFWVNYAGSHDRIISEGLL